MAWPRAQTWGDGWQAAEQASARVANSISEFEPVIMLCDPACLERARQSLSTQIDCWPFVYDDVWMRDSGPLFVLDQHQHLSITGWNFNGWGNKFRPWDNDRSLARRLARELQLDYLPADIIAEGGALHTDGLASEGAGSLLTTEQCLLNPNRNPDKTRAEIEWELRRLTGVNEIIWLGQGLEDDHTDGHIDELACFTRPGVLLLCGCDDPDDANHGVILDAGRRLRAAAEAGGYALDIIALPQPEKRQARGGERLTLSYINFYLANDAVIMPGFAQRRYDASARAIVAEQFPGRSIRQIPALPIVAGGGGIHCLTQQQPIGLAG